MSFARPMTGTRLWLRLWKAYKAFERYDLASIQSLGFRGLSDFAVLEVLLNKGPQPVSEIGKRVFLTSGSITTAVDRAERRGWVRREHATHDRRVVTVHLTEAGRAVIEPAYATHAAHLEAAAAHLTPEEQETLARLLVKAGKGVPLEPGIVEADAFANESQKHLPERETVPT